MSPLHPVTLSGHPRLLVAGLHTICLLLLGLHAWVRRLPATPTAIPEPGSAEAAWWGFWPATYAPGWAFTVATVLVLATIVAFWIVELRRPLPIAARDDSPAHTHFPWLVAISVLLLLLFYLYPIVHTRWGDAYVIAKGMAWPEPSLRLIYSWQAPLDVFLHSRAWALLHASMAWEDAMPVYRLLSPLAGALFLAALLALSRDARLAPDWLTFGLVASLGVLQLFFGYVENYSFAAAGILIYLWLARRALVEALPIWGMATALSLTNALHPSTIVLWPSALFVAATLLRRPATSRNPSPLAVVLQIAVPVVVVATATVLLMEAGGHGLAALLTSDRPGGGDASWFVPLFEATTRWQHYTMFSFAHLADFLNQQWLVAPVVLPSLLWLGVAGWLWPQSGPRSAQNRSDQNRQERTTGWMLGIATGSYWLFIWVWNPDYGGQRDWDLFSLAAIPAALLLVYLLPRRVGAYHYLRMAGVPLILLQALHTAAWIYQNTLPWAWP